MEADNAIILRHLKNGKQAGPAVTRNGNAQDNAVYPGGTEKQGVDLLFVNARGEKYSNNGLYEYLEKYLKRKGLNIKEYIYSDILMQSCLYSPVVRQ